MIINIIEGDITQLKIDAIVNAANCSLLGGGGVDGAIHRKAGKELLDECRRFNGCNTGDAIITKGYRLPSKFVIHTPGPVWHGGSQNESDLLKSCYTNCLKLASKHKLRDIAFPAISTGIYGYPLEDATSIAIRTVLHWHEKYPSEVIFVTFSKIAYTAYKKIYAEIIQLSHKDNINI
ncbi:MAG TPA: O-acetyl-ADP-ribose deacetylase [Victivallales bacterium]|nr:O-acetyl-ADP-ribose deacetylase [Victivallales bacterium]